MNHHESHEAVEPQPTLNVERRTLNVECKVRLHKIFSKNKISVLLLRVLRALRGSQSRTSSKFNHRVHRIHRNKTNQPSHSKESIIGKDIFPQIFQSLNIRSSSVLSVYSVVKNKQANSFSLLSHSCKSAFSRGSSNRALSKLNHRIHRIHRNKTNQPSHSKEPIIGKDVFPCIFKSLASSACSSVPFVYSVVKKLASTFKGFMKLKSIATLLVIGLLLSACSPQDTDESETAVPESGEESSVSSVDTTVIAMINDQPVDEAIFHAFLEFKRIPAENQSRVSKALEHYLEREALTCAIENTELLDQNSRTCVTTKCIVLVEKCSG